MPGHLEVGSNLKMTGFRPNARWVGREYGFLKGFDPCEVLESDAKVGTHRERARHGSKAHIP